jgi:hypothetical protein
MEMLVGEQKQDGVALLLDPAGRRSLISPFRSSRKCRMCMEAGVLFDWCVVSFRQLRTVVVTAGC